MLASPPSGDTWVALTPEVLPVERAAAWVALPDRGALVVFAGTVRDHAAGRPGVTRLEYEAYEPQVEPRLAAICAEARERWPQVGRLVVWHRAGSLGVGEVSVVVAVSAEHRSGAFDAARYCIDTLKETVPIWKRESWEGGADWALGSHDVTEVRP